MHTLTVTLADLEGLTHGTTAARTSVEVSARYSREVVLTEGTIIPPVVKRAAIPGDGVAAFEVFESDSPEVDPDYQGFVVVVEATVMFGHYKGGTFRRSVQVSTATSDPVALGSLPSVDGSPSPSWQAVTDARLDALEAGGGGGGAVSSVNGQTGAVTLDAAAVGALPSTYTPPAPSWGDVTGKPSTFAPSTHTHPVGDINASGAATSSTFLRGDGMWATPPSGGGGGGAVDSVNGQTGTVSLDADDVGALPSTYTPPAQSWSQITGKPSTFPPTTHSHAYADITDPPTIPGPQTLSLTGSDLTLSDGGGTVTLPSGGVGEPGLPSGRWVQTLLGQSSNNLNPTNGTIIFHPLPLNVEIEFDQIGFSLKNAGGAGTVARIGIYSTTPNGLPGTLVYGSPAIDCATVGQKVMTGIATNLGPGYYWLALVFAIQGTTPNATALVGPASGSIATADGVNGVFGPCYAADGYDATSPLPNTATLAGLRGYDRGCSTLALRVAP